MCVSAAVPGPQLSPEDEVWARLEQRMMSPSDGAMKLPELPEEAEHVFVASNGNGSLRLQPQVR